MEPRIFGRSDRILVLLSALLIAAAAPLLGACGGPSSSAASTLSPGGGLDASPGAGGSAGAGQHDLVWKFRTGGAVRSLPAVSGGAVYIRSDDGYLYALDAATGLERWKSRIGEDRDLPRYPQPSSLRVADGVVYYGGNNGGLHAIDATSGRELWTFKTGGAIRSSPAISGGLVFVGSDDGHLYAVDSATGRQRWRFKPVIVYPSDTGPVQRPSPAEVRRLPGQKVQASPVVDGGLVFVVASGILHALDKATGGWRWSYDGGWGSPGAVADGIVYQHGRALDAATGKKLWSRDEDAEPHCGTSDAAVIVEDIVYYPGLTGWADTAILVAVDRKTGHTVWTFSPSGMTKDSRTLVASLGVAGGSLYFAAHDGRLYAVDGRSGGVQWDFRPEKPVSSSPAVAGGVVYFGSYDGCLYAVR